MVSKLTIAIIIINMKRMNTPIWMLLLQLFAGILIELHFIYPSYLSH